MAVYDLDGRTMNVLTNEKCSTCDTTIPLGWYNPARPMSCRAESRRASCLWLSLSKTQRFPASVGRPASVHSKGLAINKTAFVAVGKKGNSSGNVIGCREAGHGHAP